MFKRHFPSFASRDFRIWSFGRFISVIGNQMQLVAINWHIYLLTHSAFALGLIGMARFLPFVLCGFFAGMVVDTYNRKITNLIVQFAQTFISLLLCVLTLTNHINPSIIYLLTVLYTISWAFDVPTYQAFIPSLVKRDHLGNAMNVAVTLRETAFIIGPAIAGFILASSNVGMVYLLNVLSYIAIIVSLFLVRHPGTIEEISGGFSWAAFKQGVSFVKNTTVIWSTTVLDFFSAFFGEATTLLPIFAKDILHVGPRELGLLYSAPAVGAVIAGVAFTHFQTLPQKGKVLLYAIVVYALGTVMFGLSHWFPLSLFALLIIGAGDSISTILRDVIRQSSTPDHLRGRMGAINMMFFMGGPQLGEFEAGFVASLVGAPLSVFLGGVGTLAVVYLVSNRIPALRKYRS